MVYLKTARYPCFIPNGYNGQYSNNIGTEHNDNNLNYISKEKRMKTNQKQCE